MEPLSLSVLSKYPTADEAPIWKTLAAELAGFQRKIVVLDDDPTGVQTVHGVSVYTDWAQESLLQGFREPGSMFFVLTNSRGFTVEQTRKAHREIAQNLVAAAEKAGRDFLVISRSDSTLRGHYPLETLILKEELERLTAKRFDGEIILPFFKEGGRFTIDNVHYVKDGDRLVPAGLTEFARDKSFGYNASHLGQWCQEKTAGAFTADKMIYISLDDLRNADYDAIESQLSAADGFNKVIVNAIDYSDVAVFATALVRAMGKGKEFMLRSAAAITKVVGGIPDKPLLSREELVTDGNNNGGIVLIGSHVNKTTRQLEALKQSAQPIDFIEFNQHLALEEGGLESEVCRVAAMIDKKINRGRTVAVFTRRDRLDLDVDDKDKQLLLSVRISDAVTSVIGGLAVRPRFIIAKGGITASDVGTKALHVRCALVMGQIKPGIPVWRTDEGSKFPGMPYVIFPGNVGEDSTLREIVEMLA
jgi:uncharacterized protein YgbK (DUF1537 family)